MPYKGKSRLTVKEMGAIAQGRATGKTHKEIAKDAKVSLTAVNHAHRHPVIGPLIIALKERHREELEELYALALQGIKKDLASPEADIRVRTREQVRRFISDGMAQAPEDHRHLHLTWPEFCRIYMERPKDPT